MANNTSVQNHSCQITCHPVRLRPGDKIVQTLKKFITENNLTAAFIMTCVGSVTSVSLRMAEAQTINNYKGHFEIVSLVGTLSAGGHLHASLSDNEGNVFGGHVIGDMVVYTTAEVMIGNCSGVDFKREPDSSTGYDELTIHPK